MKKYSFYLSRRGGESTIYDKTENELNDSEKNLLLGEAIHRFDQLPEELQEKFCMEKGFVRGIFPGKIRNQLNQNKMEGNTEDRPLTFGEKAVGIKFNPGGDSAVDNCKKAFADEIDRMHCLRESPEASPEKKRLASIAITELQGAQMWAVKALTWKD